MKKYWLIGDTIKIAKNPNSFNKDNDFQLNNIKKIALHPDGQLKFFRISNFQNLSL